VNKRLRKQAKKAAQKQVRKPVRKKSEVSLRARALQYLARREYSRAELRGKLLPYVQEDEDSGQSFDSSGLANLDALLDELTARGWLSDERAAMQLVHAKRSRFGMQRITHELRQKGIAENLISEALPALKETEQKAAREVWQRKFSCLPKDSKEKAKQTRFLQSRGFSIEVIFKVLRNSD
jgi:regulatory protein